MTDVPKPATVADLMAATGLGRDAVRIAIREGQLPGHHVSRRYIIPRRAFERYLAGEWEPRPKSPKEEKPKPVDFLHRNERKNDREDASGEG